MNFNFLKIKYKVEYILIPILLLLPAFNFYNIILPYKPYPSDWEFQNWYIALKWRYFLEFSMLFGLINIAALRISLIGFVYPQKITGRLIGTITFWPIIIHGLIFLSLMVPLKSLGSIIEYFVDIGTLVIIFFALILLIWGLIKKSWRLPLSSFLVLTCFGWVLHSYTFAMIVTLFGD